MPAFRRPAPADSVVSVAELHATALRLLGRRELSRHQLRQRLMRLCRDDETVAAVVDRLAASGLLDDERVARAYARTASQVKRRGRERILRELAQMGIGGDVARAAVDEACGVEAERETLSIVIRRRARGLDLADAATRRRLFASLLRQGFDADEVRRALLAHGELENAAE